MLTLYGIPNCDTVKRARAWLSVRGIDHQFHDYKRAGIDAETLSGWAGEVGWEVLFNRAGTTFRKLDSADKAAIDQAKAIVLMLSSPSLIKRPVVTGAGDLLVGFKEELWAGRFG